MAESRERPILFSAPMVRAILAGTKTQTRRVMAHPPDRESIDAKWWTREPNQAGETTGATYFPGSKPARWLHFESAYVNGLIDYRRPEVDERPTKKQAVRRGEWLSAYKRDGACWSEHEVSGICPYGFAGGKLWVRETWQMNEPPSGAIYRADDIAGHIDGGWRPSIFMPRWASRITLNVTGVRLELLQDISEEDAIAEGARPAFDPGDHPLYADVKDRRHRLVFEGLWDKINGKRAPWASNPWVWVVSFERVKP